MSTYRAISSCLTFGLLAYGTAHINHPIIWGFFAAYIALSLHTSLALLEDDTPQGTTIHVNKDDLDEHPDIVTEHMRIVTKLEDYIASQEQTANTQHRLADDLDKGIYDETFGKIDVDKMPPQAYRAAARANQWTANYLRRTLNPVKEEQ